MQNEVRSIRRRLNSGNFIAVNYFEERIDMMMIKIDKMDSWLKNINGSIRQLLSNELIERTQVAMEESLIVLRRVNAFDKRLVDILEKLPVHVKKANFLSDVAEDYVKKIRLIRNMFSKLQNVIKGLKISMQNVDNKFKSVDKYDKQVDSKIKKLRNTFLATDNLINGIELSMKFDKDSYIKHVNPSRIEELAISCNIELYFKTSIENGFLLYLGNEIGTKKLVSTYTSEDFLAIEIINGFLNVIFELGSGAQRLVNNKIYVSDSKWKKLTLDRKGRYLSIMVTHLSNDHIKSYFVETYFYGTKSLLTLDSHHSSFYIGGFPILANIQKIVQYNSFVGEILSLTINGRIVGLWNFEYQKNIQANYLNYPIRPKSSQTEIHISSGGYSAYSASPFDFEHRFSLYFRFLTHSSDGSLFYVQTALDNSSISVKLLSSAIVFQLVSGSTTTLLQGGAKLNDGVWHTIDVSTNDGKIVLKIDSIVVDEDNYKPLKNNINFASYLYLGRYYNEFSRNTLFDRDFEGCIKEVYLSGTTLNLDNSEKSSGTSSGCHLKRISDVSFSERDPGYISIPYNSTILSQITLKFRTTKTEGLLFFASNNYQNTHISLSLNAGNLVLIWSRHGQLSTRNLVSYNDGKWHLVTITIKSLNIRLEIDDYEIFTTPVKNLEIILDKEIFFGGIPSHFNIPNELIASREFWSGCIGDVNINDGFINFAVFLKRLNVYLSKCDSENNGYLTPVSSNTNENIYLPPTPRKTSIGSIGCKKFSRTNAKYISIGNTSSIHKFDQSLSSYLTYHTSNISSTGLEQISFYIKTTSSIGSVFYAVSNRTSHYIHLYLKNGQIIFRFTCNIEKYVEIQSQCQINDDHWHYIRIVYQFCKSELYVDNKLESLKSTFSSANYIFLPSFMIFGSLKMEISWLEKHGFCITAVNSFTGSLKNVFLNNDIYDLNLMNTHNIRYHEYHNANNAYFFDRGGYVEIAPYFNVGESIDFEFDFRAENNAGVLFAVHGKIDFVLVQLIDNGTIRASVNNGDGEVIVEHNYNDRYAVCNGQWRSVKVFKIKNILTLSVDNEPAYFTVHNSSFYQTNTGSAVFVGGVRSRADFPAAIPATDHFVGCVRNLVVKGHKDWSVMNGKVFGDVVIHPCPAEDS